MGKNSWHAKVVIVVMMAVCIVSLGVHFSHVLEIEPESAVEKMRVDLSIVREEVCYNKAVLNFTFKFF